MTNWLTSAVRLTTSADSVRERIDVAATDSVYHCQRCCANRYALLTFSVSSPSTASTARPWRCEPSFIDSRMLRASGACAAAPTINTIAIAATGITARGGAIAAITAMNSTTNGRSISAVSVAEVSTSRTDSKSRRLLTKAPDEAGLPSSRIESNRANRPVEISWSARRPAASISQPRSVRARNSKASAIPVPAVSTHSVS